uniref:Putative sorting nexin-29 n=1 Tax=Xenopsylla cheopis TaxID=163159 RepID=A0A6M2DGY4_XENCH
MNTIMSAILSANNPTTKIVDKQILLANLHNAVKMCQNKYGGRTELATESDHSIVNLCHCFESVLNHGLRTQPTSALKQMAEFIAGSESPTFWSFVEHQLTNHEKERYSSLRQVWTDRGKARALLRAALNERSLERYLHCWLGHSTLSQYYEEWAIMRDTESSAMLPNLAAGLGSILFALTIESVDLNSSKDLSLESLPRSEPIIAVPPATIPKKISRNHHIISFDDDDDDEIASIIKVNTSVIKPAMTLETNSKNLETEPDTVNSEQNSDSFKTDEKVEFIAIIKRDENKSVAIYQSIPQQSTSDGTLDQVSSLSDSGLGEGPFPLVESYASSTISLKESVDSAESNNLQADIEVLKLKLEEKEDRCNWLEARVAELSLENQQLKELSSAAPCATSFSINIPKVHKIGSHYEYEICITANRCNESWRLLRRYNDFYNLHKELCKKNPRVNMVDFPPKKTIGNMSNVVVEERRQRLQAYLRQLFLLLPQLSGCVTKYQLERTLSFFRRDQEV